MLRSAALLATVFVGFLPGPTAAATAVFHKPIVAIGANQSNNWSGYNQGTLEQGGKQFHSVVGNWTVPTATAHVKGENEYSSTWIGIGGGCVDAGCTVTDPTLIQAGTEQDVDSAGNASYSAWWEIIPEPSTPISLPVKAGDQIHVAITEGLPEVWTITIQDLTTSQGFTTTTPYPSSYATAEWIEETPVVIDNSGNLGIGPLPNLTSPQFDLAATNGSFAGLKASEEMQLVNGSGGVLEQPSAPDGDADGFNDCSYTTGCAAPTSS